jgi:mannose/cellobiose epimerase-like protein (N-acyl-D-glucosamine 2-epimerase family)
VNTIDFTFSDTIAGYVTAVDWSAKTFRMRTSDGRPYQIQLTPATYARLVQNLDEPHRDVTGRLAELLTPGQPLYAYGLFYPESCGDPSCTSWPCRYAFEAKSLAFPAEGADRYRHEEPEWWTTQLASIARSYLKWQFGYPRQPIDYREYRTFLHLGGTKKGDVLQETDTISRLVYGFATAFMMTGDRACLDAAEAGTEYLREHMRFYDADSDLIYWYHGIHVSGGLEQKLLSSEFGDDYDSIPIYEQIYALAGPVQTYRVTGDPRILSDARQTMKLFERYYRDHQRGGYFSHLDPLTLDPRADTLGRNRARKNWNSIGDHAPAYLINLYLATGDRALAYVLEDTFNTIVARFPDFDRGPFVHERFHEDWEPDTTWGWQQDRAVVGHNLKIAWNLTRMYGLRPKQSYRSLASRIGACLPDIASDRQRGGWYDVLERTSHRSSHRHTWHDRKAWWQQEQAILAYLIMHGVYGDEAWRRHAREAAAFYNTFFLDHDDGGVYFNTLANGLPYLLGNERLKGSHSMSGYHSTELCYLSAVYLNLLIEQRPLDLYFMPRPDGFEDRVLRVAPDLLPAGRVRLDSVEIDGERYRDFDPEAMTVALPRTDDRVHVHVRLAPVARKDD